MGILEKIADIEKEIARTQKNKATENHLGSLRGFFVEHSYRKLARLRTQLVQTTIGKKGGGEGFDVVKSGDCRVAMIGFPSVGKSSLLNALTGKSTSEAAAHEFTTLTCIPGALTYNNTRIQLLDLPGIVEGAHEGRGRGRQVIGVARTSDVVLMMLDCNKGELQKKLLTKELLTVGLRLNQKPPDITVVKKAGGGIKYTAAVKTTYLNEKMCTQLLRDYKMHNVEVLIREDATVSQFIDVLEGNRVYVKCLYVYNKIDTITIEEVDKLAKQHRSVVCSVSQRWGLDVLMKQLWNVMEVRRIYTKKRGQLPDLNEPMILRGGESILALCNLIHKDMKDHFKSAHVWGMSAKHNPQIVGLKHKLCDEDVVQIMVEGGGMMNSGTHSKSKKKNK